METEQNSCDALRFSAGVAAEIEAREYYYAVLAAAGIARRPTPRPLVFKSHRVTASGGFVPMTVYLPQEFCTQYARGRIGREYNAGYSRHCVAMPHFSTKPKYRK